MTIDCEKKGLRRRMELGLPLKNEAEDVFGVSFSLRKVEGGGVVEGSLLLPLLCREASSRRPSKTALASSSNFSSEKTISRFIFCRVMNPEPCKSLLLADLLLLPWLEYRRVGLGDGCALANLGERARSTSSPPPPSPSFLLLS